MSAADSRVSVYIQREEPLMGASGWEYVVPASELSGRDIRRVVVDDDKWMAGRLDQARTD
jgi:hypothetical protein